MISNKILSPRPVTISANNLEVEKMFVRRFRKPKKLFKNVNISTQNRTIDHTLKPFDFQHWLEKLKNKNNQKQKQKMSEYQQENLQKNSQKSSIYLSPSKLFDIYGEIRKQQKDIKGAKTCRVQTQRSQKEIRFNIKQVNRLRTNNQIKSKIITSNYFKAQIQRTPQKRLGLMPGKIKSADKDPVRKKDVQFSLTKSKNFMSMKDFARVLEPGDPIPVFVNRVIGLNLTGRRKVLQNSRQMQWRNSAI